MIPLKTSVWTDQGYRSVMDLTVGDRVTSYSHDRNCLEYDYINSIETRYERVGLVGPCRMNAHYLCTPEHPVLMYDPKTRLVSRVKMDDIFMTTFMNKKILGLRPFEPYLRFQDKEEIEWTARMAASSTRNHDVPLYNDEIWNCIRDITGEEAQIWLHAFFHWNILKPNANYMKTTFVKNSFVRDMLYHVAPRAGVSTYWGRYVKIKKTASVNAFSITRQQDSPVSDLTQWRADRHDGIIYNIGTKNGSFLAKYLGGTFIMACNY